MVSGTGRATVHERHVALEVGSLLLIEAGEPHEITNDGGEPLVIVNVYTRRPKASITRWRELR